MARTRDGMLGQGGQRRKMPRSAFRGKGAVEAARADAADGKAEMLARIKARAEKRQRKSPEGERPAGGE